jgi:hypothetical protein
VNNLVACVNQRAGRKSIVHSGDSYSLSWSGATAWYHSGPNLASRCAKHMHDSMRNGVCKEQPFHHWLTGW